ncbi:MAG: universal stress protein [Candidatus Hydrogenedentes bacterium]|nr:universal stress protein [Candidatus Hydrogenedentota bacterium]
MFTAIQVLFPTDFSPYAHYAMRYAFALAKRYKGAVHIAHCVESSALSIAGMHGFDASQPELETLLNSMREHAESRLAHYVQMAHDDGIDATHHIVSGRPSHEIIKLAEELDCVMIVIATHGRTGFDHVVFGSVCEQVVRHSPIPVLSVKHPEHDFVEGQSLDINIRRVLFPTDFSEYSVRALPYAESLCREFGATLVLFHSTEAPNVPPDFWNDLTTTNMATMGRYAEEALAHIKEGVKDVECEVISATGSAYREIVRLVEDSEVDLVVIPTHGRSGLAHVMFGSVAERVVRRAPCPVLTIRLDDK